MANGKPHFAERAPVRPHELLRKAALTHQERNTTYGNTWEGHGGVLKALFPDGLQLVSEEDFTRFGVLNMVVSKLCRYAAAWDKGGHQDSSHDMQVYSAMLEALTK